MKILIDARPLMDSPRGIGQFLLNALEALSNERSDWCFVLSANRPLHPESLARIDKMNNVHVELDLKYGRAIVWLLLRFGKLVKKHKADWVWFPAGVGSPLLSKKHRSLVTVHDVVNKEFCGTMSLRNRLVSALLFDRSICTADLLWTVSEYTKTRVEHYFPRRRSNQIVVGSSVNMQLFHPIALSVERTQQIKAQYTIDQASKILLFVGTLEPRKNLGFLLSLMPRLALDGYELLVVGGRGWGKTDIAQIVAQEGFPSEKVHFAGYITDYELLELYNLCSCYVSTALNEGFGMPQLEAICCGAPVVTANNSAMTEVVVGAGVLVDGWDEAAWIEAIQGATKEPNAAAYERKRAEYDWNLIARRVVQQIEEIK